MGMQKLISVIIVNYNYGHFLEEAIKSVINQSCKDFELIVVDGGSTDNSVDVIKKYSNEISWWCSEPDKGQSDAFNKGFSHATGRFLTWLNADDVFFPGSLERAKKAISSNSKCEWFTSGCFWLDPELKVIKCSSARKFSKLRAKRGQISVWAPSSFFAKELLDRVGGVDVDFHYMMDTELWLRFYKQAGVTYLPIPGYCWGLRLHPDAKMSGHNFSESQHSEASHPKWKQMKQEWQTFIDRHGQPTPLGILRWLTTPPFLYFKNKLDTLRYKGKPYKSCFPCAKDLSL